MGKLKRTAGKPHTSNWRLILNLHSWHADIKPDNILIIQGKFKLADPGFATFVKATNGSDAVAQLAGGTETYGNCFHSRAARSRF